MNAGVEGATGLNLPIKTKIWYNNANVCNIAGSVL